MKSVNLIRHVNELRCLRLLRRGSPMSRAGIARELGLTRATVGSVITALMADDLVIEVEQPQGSGRVGRPGILVDLDPRGAFFVGIDVSSDMTTGVVVDFGAHVINRIGLTGHLDFADPDSVAQKIADLVRRLVVGAAVDPMRVRGVGVAVPGIVDRSGVVVSAKLLDWEDLDIGGMIAGHLGAPWPIKVCNDAVALSAVIGALDEPRMSDMLVVLLSEGVGGTIVRNGRVVEGVSGFAGEIGHMILSLDPADAKTRTLGMLGGYLPFLPLLPASDSVADGLRQLHRAPSTPAFEQTLSNWANVLGLGMTNLVHVLNPERIVFGGPLAILFPRVQDTVRILMSQCLLHGLVPPPMSTAGFDADAVACGAAGTVRDDLFLLPELERMDNGEGLRPGADAQDTVQPPSTAKFAPVTSDAAGEAR